MSADEAAQRRVDEAMGRAQNDSSAGPTQGTLVDGTGSDGGILRVDRQHGTQRMLGGRR